MTDRYNDILHLPHPVSPHRAPMSVWDRAAQFSPFAALTGFDAVIQETARLTDQPFELACDGAALLDRQLRILARHQDTWPEVTVTCFVPDVKKAGGAYLTITGKLRAVLPQKQILLLTDGQALPFSRIFRLESPVL